jgi:hypothetical protein
VPSGLLTRRHRPNDCVTGIGQPVARYNPGREVEFVPAGGRSMACPYCLCFGANAFCFCLRFVCCRARCITGGIITYFIRTWLSRITLPTWSCSARQSDRRRSGGVSSISRGWFVSCYQRRQPRLERRRTALSRSRALSLTRSLAHALSRSHYLSLALSVSNHVRVVRPVAKISPIAVIRD